MKKYDYTFLLICLATSFVLSSSALYADNEGEMNILPIIEGDTFESPPFIEKDEVAILPIETPEGEGVIALEKDVIEGPDVEEETSKDRNLVLLDHVPILRLFPQVYGQKELRNPNRSVVQNWAQAFRWA